MGQEQEATADGYCSLGSGRKVWGKKKVLIVKMSWLRLVLFVSVSFQ
jgi:hypothetical protein